MDSVIVDENVTMEPVEDNQSRDLRAILPSLSGNIQRSKPLNAETRQSLRNSVPSMSGVLGSPSSSKKQGFSFTEEPIAENVNISAAYVPDEAELVGEYDEDDIMNPVNSGELIIEDADDSDYGETITESGAYSGEGYVDMPKSRVKRLFGKFRHNKHKSHESTPQEWLDVDESFDAPSVGAARQSWESFRDDYDDDFEDVEITDVEEDVRIRDHEETSRRPHSVTTKRRSSHPKRRWNGGGFSREQLGRVSTLSEDVQAVQTPVEPVETVQAELSGKIVQFHNPEINVEVWFVALGSELAQNGGMRAFLEEHEQEMRGAIIVELEGLGAGNLSLIDEEGLYFPRKISSRMGRMIRKASNPLGMTVGKSKMLWKDSAAGVALKHGLQAMHLAGIEGGKPAHINQENDVLENINPEKLHQNSDFIMELLKSI